MEVTFYEMQVIYLMNAILAFLYSIGHFMRKIVVKYKNRGRPL